MSGAKRFPRERFTRSLISLCKRLDLRHQLEFEYASPRGDLVPMHGRMSVDARVLWAFGSWAQGAPDCGDLDLALDLLGAWVDGHGWLRDNTKAKGLPGFDPARKAILTAPPLVHILDAGDIRRRGPAGAIVVQPEMLIPIWVAPDLTDIERKMFGVNKFPTMHWSERIESIKLDAAYQRSARPADSFPLAIEQTAMDLDRIEGAVLAQAQGLIEWAFIPHGQHRDDAPSLTKAERALQAVHQCNDMAQSARVIAETRELRKRHRKALFWYGNKCGVWPKMFEACKADCIVITPRWRGRGPNGSLVLTKGPNYSTDAVKAFDAKHP